MLEVSRIIAEEVKAIVRAVLDSPAGINKKVKFNTLGKDKSRLYDDVMTALQNSDNIVITLLLNHYIQFIESGRRAGARMPPFTPIYEWCKRKGLSTSNDFVWAVCKAISRDGIEPRPIMSSVFTIIDEKFDGDWSDRIFDELTKRLDDIFR